MLAGPGGCVETLTPLAMRYASECTFAGFTRPTNGFGKKLSHLEATVDRYMAWYDFCWVDQTCTVKEATTMTLSA
jgi:hypothetical protein